MFTKGQLSKLLFPLLGEQALTILVGIVASVMVAKAGESAVSAVSLVNSINTLLISFFAAMATGGAVICSNSIGSDDKKMACETANQLVLIMTVVSAIFTVFSVLFNNQILALMFGGVEPEIMSDARIYFYFTALSFPALGLFNACSAIYRAMGNSKVSLIVAVVMNGINIVGNFICIYCLNMGVEGVAFSVLFARIVAAVIMLYIIKKPDKYIYIKSYLQIRWNTSIISNILRIAVPNGFESSMFHFAKLILQSLVTTLGTVSIVANAVAWDVCTLAAIPTNALMLGVVTVVGRCAGAGKYNEIKKYTWSFIIMNVISLVVFGLAAVIFIEPILRVYNISPESSELAKTLIIMYSCIAILIWPLSAVMPCALRAVFDVKYTMVTGIASAFIFRVGLAYILVLVFKLGLIGEWIAMFTDWGVRALFFTWRFVRMKWISKLEHFQCKQSSVPKLNC